ncbi:hypothetical protein D3C77_330720 [compost metagenome]
MGVGDANLMDPIPSRDQKKLINERRRAPLNQVKVDPDNASIIIAEQIIPPDVGGWWIREIGLYDSDGDLVAVANCAPSFKPLLSQGTGKTQVVRLNIIVTSSANVELKIDPAVVLATREYVDTEILTAIYKLGTKQSVRAATTVNIVLRGLQSLDTILLSAGDRVLVKNQVAASQNGIYSVSADAWLRALDTDQSAEVSSGMIVTVEQGATLADTRWQLITDGSISLGTTPLTFQNVTQGFAPILSPAFLGTPIAPTPARFDTSARIATMAALQTRGSQFSGYTIFSGVKAGEAAHVGGVVHCAGAGSHAYSLPDASTNSIAVGASIRVQNWSTGALSLSVQGTDKLQETIDGVWNSAVRLLPPDSYVDCIYVGTHMWILTGPGVYGKTRPFSAGLGSSGWQKLPSGLIMQWVRYTFPVAANNVAVGLPLAFPTTHLAAWGTSTDSAIYGASATPFVAATPNGLSAVLTQSNYTASQSAIQILSIGF